MFRQKEAVEPFEVAVYRLKNADKIILKFVFRNIWSLIWKI